MSRDTRPSSVATVLKILRSRPGRLPELIRGQWLFYTARLLHQCIPVAGVSFGSNVRFQKRRSLIAELPAAHITIGSHAILYEDARIEAYGQGTISIGQSSVVGAARIFSRHRITIGDRFLSSWGVFIQDFDPHPIDPGERRLQVEHIVASMRPRFEQVAPPAPYTSSFPSAPIVIGDDVWVGANATILKGVQIGSGSIVAAGAVVVKGVYPERSVLAGNPARIVRQL